MKTPEKQIRGNIYIFWVLRGFLLLVGLFFMLFSFDVFSENISFWQKVVGFLIHNVFAFFIFGVLYVAWKSEHYAGFLLIVMSICMVFFFGGPTGIREGTWMMIGLPFLVGILFLVNYYLIKPKK
jgi:hypothetical protein